jgi:hypothetical protein
MTQATAVECQRKFGEFQHKVLREPVEITRHGRREFEGATIINLFR